MAAYCNVCDQHHLLSVCLVNRRSTAASTVLEGLRECICLFMCLSLVQRRLNTWWAKKMHTYLFYSGDVNNNKCVKTVVLLLF